LTNSIRKGGGEGMVKSKSSPVPERRRYPRFEYPFYVVYKKAGKFKREVSGPSAPFYFIGKEEKLSVSQNISIGGICFVTKEEFLPGIKLSVKIWTPTRHSPLVGQVKVVWQKKRTLAPGYFTGVSFISLDDKKELKSLLEMLTDLKLEEMLEK